MIYQISFSIHSDKREYKSSLVETIEAESLLELSSKMVLLFSRIQHEEVRDLKDRLRNCLSIMEKHNLYEDDIPF